MKGDVAKKSMNPLDQCANQKKVYDLCFKQWYSTKFLKGSVELGDECEEPFEALQVCINKAVEENNRRRNQ